MLFYILRRSVFNYKTAAVLCVSIALLYFEMFYVEDLLHMNLKTVSSFEILCNIYALSPYIIIVGLFPGIPFAYSFLEERNSGYLKYILQRMPIKKYIGTKMVWTGLSGAVIMLIPFLMVVIPALLMAHGPADAGHMADYMWSECIRRYGTIAAFCMKGFLAALFGVLWAEMAFLVTLFVNNRYVAFICPFLIFQVFWLLFPVPVWNPVYLIRSDWDAGMWLWQPVFTLILYIVIVCIMIYIEFQRRYQNDGFA